MNRACGRTKLLVVLAAVIAASALGVRTAGADPRPLPGGSQTLFNGHHDSPKAPAFKFDPTPCGDGVLLILPVGAGVFVAQVLPRVDSEVRGVVWEARLC